MKSSFQSSPTQSPLIKIIMRITLILLLAKLSVSDSVATEFKDGDIIFQRSQSAQAKAIATATHSDYTHVGIIFLDHGKPFVFEAIQPVTKTPLQDWINRGVKKHFVVKRLKEASKLDPVRLRKEAEAMIGKDYDWLFEWSDDRIYCSELVWKSYKNATGLELGKLRALQDFDLQHESVKRIMKDRYGANIPFEMKVTSPSDIFDSALLVEVKED